MKACMVGQTKGSKVDLDLYLYPQLKLFIYTWEPAKAAAINAFVQLTAFLHYTSSVSLILKITESNVHVLPLLCADWTNTLIKWVNVGL